MSKGRILIVDDDARMVESAANLLGDEGFEVSCVSTWSDALPHLAPTPPEVILLELWLPEQDGMAILQEVKRQQPMMPVIVVSEHGSIATAIKAVKGGAFDYLEKPCRPEAILASVRQAVQPGRADADAPIITPSPPATAVQPLPVITPDTPYLTPTASPQRTLARSTVVRGQGLQSGLKTAMQLSPLPPGHGIVFRNIDTGQTLPAAINAVDSTNGCTSLRQGPVAAKTIEHLMSALHAYRITNLLVTISDEIPFMDGSALDFCTCIEAAGISEQDAEVECLTVEKRYHVGDVTPETKFILVEPYDGLRVTYRVHYPPPIGIEEWTYEHHSGASYRETIAPARTFAFVEDVEHMHEAGLIPGGRLNNVILIGKSGIVNSSPLRFANEFVRHKILDIIGDLYLLGRPIRGHVRANMTGHTENVALVRSLQDVLALA
ncbi:MAG: UDP-3-O-acyl-N-acetylglucosamine deacetylase [Candidatus Tectomicrobia bacterium]|nr:UDP-3-O-acyl-N-acetylglucosamine deacetylase [Candidatus Tectomicrobia bacterium]